MKLLLMLITLIPSISFAVVNCMNYPTLGDHTTIFKGKISEISRDLSFGDCPDSVLVNEQFVARLLKIANHDEKLKCIYSLPSVNFICEK